MTEGKSDWQHEAALEELEATLRQAVSRLTMLASESNPELASILDQLREKVRGESQAGEIKSCLEELGQKIRQTEKSEPGSEQGTVLISNLIDQLETRAAATESLEKLQQRTQRQMRDLEIQLLVDDLAALLNRELAGTDENPELAAAQGTTALAELITDLLNRLSLPPEQRKEADDLIDRLQDRSDTSIISTALDRIADMVAGLRAELQSERRGNEQFLNQLTQNLQTLESTLVELESGHQASFADGQKMDTQLSSHMQGLENSMHQAENLNGLKEAITTRLDHIRSNMEEFRRNEDSRNNVLEDQVNRLRDRVGSMEQESSELRDRIAQEHRKAMSDPLTEIPNRLAYDEYIRQEYARWKRYQKPLSLAVWDIDRFKAINDSYGHKAGDKVLKAIATLLKKKTREADFVARYGGEEFVMLMPQTARKDALEVAEKLRKEIEKCGFHFRGEDVKVTISCGLTEFSGDDTPLEAFERADKGLYQAKGAGRNRCLGV